MFVPLDTEHWRTDSRGCTRRIPFHTEHFHSGRATTQSFSVNGANTVSSFVMRSETSGTVFAPLDNTALAHNHDNTTTVRGVSPVQKVRILSMLLHDSRLVARPPWSSSPIDLERSSPPSCGSRPLGTWSCRKRHWRTAYNILRMSTSHSCCSVDK